MKQFHRYLYAAALLAAGSAQAQFFNLAGTGVQGIYGLSADGRVPRPYLCLLL